MAINIIERAIVPYNTSTNIITQKEKYHLFAPIAGLNKVGMAGFDPSQFVIRNGVVSIKSNIGNGTDFKLSDLEDDENHRTVTDVEKQIWNDKASVEYVDDLFETNINALETMIDESGVLT